MDRLFWNLFQFFFSATDNCIFSLGYAEISSTYNVFQFDTKCRAWNWQSSTGDCVLVYGPADPTEYETIPVPGFDSAKKCWNIACNTTRERSRGQIFLNFTKKTTKKSTGFDWMYVISFYQLQINLLQLAKSIGLSSSDIALNCCTVIYAYVIFCRMFILFKGMRMIYVSINVMFFVSRKIKYVYES